MRGREHGGEDRFERWEMRGKEQGEEGRFKRLDGRERGRLRKWEWWDKFRVRKYSIYTCFFFSRDSLVEPGRFGSVQSVLDFENRNRTKPEIFCDFLISLIGFFHGSVFSVFFPVFSV